MSMLRVGDIVRIKRQASSVFGGCTARIKSIHGDTLGVEILAPNMRPGNGPWVFTVSEVSFSRHNEP